MIRHLHPAAWWLWAIALAASASLTTNPALLAAHGLVLTGVVMARRDGSPWGRAFRLYAALGAVIVALSLGRAIAPLEGSALGKASAPPAARSLSTCSHS